MPRLIDLSIAAAALLLPTMSWADENSYRLAAQEVCFSDVLSLCSEEVPDEGRIMACMSARRSHLSAPCRKAFDAGIRATRRANR